MGLLKEEAFFFLICSKVPPRSEVALLSLERAWWSGVGNVQCLGPPRQRSGSVGYLVWSPAGGRGWRQGVIIVGGRSNGELRGAAGSRLGPGYKASTKGPSGQDRPRPWG